MSFYVMEFGHRFFADFAEGNEWEAVVCPLDAGHRRSGERITPLHIELPSPKVPNFMTTILSDRIITDETARLFQAESFTGYMLKPLVVVKVRRGDLNDLPKLWEFVVIGKAGDVAPRSGIRLIRECPACGSTKYTGFGEGLFVDESQWDGSDFFTVWPLPKFELVTERVKEFVEAHKLKNCTFIPTEQLVGKGAQGGLMPGRRQDWLALR